jgi:tRNA pseudouridine38-40 synthase
MLRHYVLHIGQPLAKEALKEALQVLPGTHDFAAFGSATQPGGSTIRQCRSATWSSVELFGRSLVAIELVANGFLRQMIRALVGTLILVGRRQLTPAAFAQILQSYDRRRAGPTAAAHGLTLMAVGYPPAAMLLEN